jgi:hypothetical protein
MTYSVEEIRKILLEHRYFYTAVEVCKKWEITNYRLRQWKKVYSYAYRTIGVREMTVVALHNGATTIPDIRSVLDYLDHGLYTDREILKIVKQLETQGLVHDENGRWLYNKMYSKNDTGFIF